MDALMEFFQQYATLFGILTGILTGVGTVLGVAFTIYKATHDRQIKELQRRIDELQAENERLRQEGNEALRPLVQQLQARFDEAKEEVQKARDAHALAKAAWDNERDARQAECDRERGAAQALTSQLEEKQEELARRDRADQAHVRLLRKNMRLEGRIWQRKVLQGAPRFRPLAERHVAVLSVLNLKGGVGKTTVTAHLGAALSAKGYNVLLLDLDLQGSLSSLFMTESALVQRSKDKRLLQHFLLSVAERRRANLLECCVPILDGRSAMVPSADSMAYAELNLTMQWLLRLGRRDTRFLLRKALHQKRVTRRFDIVLLDCPPLFNTCCVNALAASDYVLIPVLPSQKATERVPLLLERLKGLHRIINPELQVMGALLNRTHAAQMTAMESDLWRDMLEQAQTQWGLPVHAFGTTIRQTTEVRDSETEFSPPEPGSELHGVFSRITAELEERLPRECRRTAAAPYGPG
jgi:chromosome partitioning protein